MLWDTEETFVTSSGDLLYALHPDFLFPFYFYNRNKKKYLIETNARQLAPSQVRPLEDQGGERFAMWGRTPVANQPSAASTLSVVSSSASDTTSGKAVTVRGTTTNGITSESLTPTGTTPVVTTNSYTKILQVTKAAVWVGNMTMTSDAGAVTNLFLFPNELGRSYQQIQLMFDPVASDTIAYRFYRKPSPLVNDNDIPDIPEPFSQILVYDAMLAVSAYNNMNEPARLQEWTGKQRAWEEAMVNTFFEGGSIEAEPKFVRSNFNDEFDGRGPRFVR